ncbi:hypothetical protein HCEG_05696 [Histoplasma capsulatum var. duboisii H88]|uniref:Uncharacterized protein n=1 Tax=Ajellomyces capsulatus (strain H88) TaxID=544711 RepID=F0UIY4_AJEC8|nr:hypothetical protein HCEG_05696 [Histoplasma capsulatum var. duboisii H88]
MTLVHHTSKDPGLSREYAATHETTSMSVRWINFIRVQIVGSKRRPTLWLIPQWPVSLRLEDPPNPLSILWLLLVLLPSGESQPKFSDTAKQSIHPYGFGFQKFGESIRGTSIKLVATEVCFLETHLLVRSHSSQPHTHACGRCGKITAVYDDTGMLKREKLIGQVKYLLEIVGDTCLARTRRSTSSRSLEANAGASRTHLDLELLVVSQVRVRLVKPSWHFAGVCSKCSFARECSSGYWWMPLFSLVHLELGFKTHVFTGIHRGFRWLGSFPFPSYRRENERQVSPPSPISQSSPLKFNSAGTSVERE